MHSQMFRRARRSGRRKSICRNSRRLRWLRRRRLRLAGIRRCRLCRGSGRCRCIDVVRDRNAIWHHHAGGLWWRRDRRCSTGRARRSGGRSGAVGSARRRVVVATDRSDRTRERRSSEEESRAISHDASFGSCCFHDLRTTERTRTIRRLHVTRTRDAGNEMQGGPPR